MQLVIMLLLIAVSCILIQSVYDMTDTALGNAGLNAKPIDNNHFERVKENSLKVWTQRTSITITRM